jgi:hypothetical protein
MRTTRSLLTAGGAGPVLFVLMATVDGATRPGYNAWIDYVSHLSLGDGGIIERANLLLCGSCALALACGVGRIVRSGPVASLGPALLSTFGSALAAAGLFVGDPGRGYPPGASLPTGQHSLHGIVHELAGLVAFAAIVAAMFVFARYFAVDQRSRGWALYSLGTGVAVMAVAAIVIGLTVAHGGTTGDLPVGALQRIAIGAGWGWLALLALRLRPMRGAEYVPAS